MVQAAIFSFKTTLFGYLPLRLNHNFIKRVMQKINTDKNVSSLSFLKLLLFRWMDVSNKRLLIGDVTL